MLDASFYTNSLSNSQSDDTDSTQTDTIPSYRHSDSIDGLPDSQTRSHCFDNENYNGGAADNTVNQSQQSHVIDAGTAAVAGDTLKSSFRKCQSCVYLSATTTTDKLQNVVIDNPNYCGGTCTHHHRNTIQIPIASSAITFTIPTPTVVYMAVKQDQHFVAYLRRIFNRWKVISICFVSLVTRSFSFRSVFICIYGFVLVLLRLYFEELFVSNTLFQTILNS